MKNICIIFLKSWKVFCISFSQLFLRSIGPLCWLKQSCRKMDRKLGVILKHFFLPPSPLSVINKAYTILPFYFPPKWHISNEDIYLWSLQTMVAVNLFVSMKNLPEKKRKIHNEAKAISAQFLESKFNAQLYNSISVLVIFFLVKVIYPFSDI